jgi:D-alanyl-D-alanine carboxypeptidase/D-alanyl-D-alanine-endopeptidase (penicillin-binding protein 4)
MFFPQKRIKYQMSPTQAELQRGHQARWRRLETVIKQALNGQPVAIIYRGNELLLQDEQADHNRVLNALLNLRKKYPFAIAVSSRNVLTHPSVLWIENPSLVASTQRLWTIREAVT